MYFFSFLIFTGLVVNAVTSNHTVSVTVEDLEKITPYVTKICACSKYRLNESVKCNNKTGLFNNEGIDDFCHIYSKTLNTTTESVPPLTTETVTTPTTLTTNSIQNTTLNGTVTSSTKVATSSTSSSTNSTENTPTTLASTTSAPVTSTDKNNSTKEGDGKQIFDVACICVPENSSLPNGPKNCTLIQKSNGIYKPSQKTTDKFNETCQNSTWESVTPRADNNTAKALSLFTICSKDKTECLSGRSWDSVVNSLQALCACANKPVGNVTIPCGNKDDWSSLKVGISSQIDGICEHLRNLTVKPKEVILQNITETSTTEGAIAQKFIQENSETKYSTGTMVGIGLCAFVCGTFLAFAIKMSHSRYRKRTYVNQGRA